MGAQVKQATKTWAPHFQLRQLMAVSLSIGAAQVLLALGGVVTAHALGPEGKGVVTVVSTWGQMLAWLFLVNLNTACSVRLAASRGLATSSVIGNAVLYTLIVGGVAACASAVVLSMLLVRLGADARLAVAVGMVTIPVEMLGTLLQSVNVALGKTREFNLARVAAPCVVIPALLVMWGLTGLTPLRVVVATIVGAAVALVIAGYRLPWRHLRIDLSTLRSDLHFGVRLLPAGLLFLANARLDILLMSVVMSAGQIGLYSVANNAMMPATLVASAMTLLITPAVAQMTPAISDRRSLAAQRQVDYIERHSRLIVATTAVLAIVLAPLAPVLLPLVFGAAFGPAVLPFWILMFGSVARSYAVTVSAGASGMRKAWVGNAAEAAGFVATALLLPLLLWRYGIVGAAVASASSYVASAGAAILSLQILRRRVARDLTHGSDAWTQQPGGTTGS